MKDTSGSAFPISVRRNENYMDEGGYGHTRVVTVQEGGMTLRDYFAGQALAGLAMEYDSHPETAAMLAYRLADAMIAMRKGE